MTTKIRNAYRDLDRVLTAFVPWHQGTWRRTR